MSKFFGSNLVHFLILVYVSEHKSLPEIYGDLTCAPKPQQLVVLQRVLELMVCCLEVRAPTVYKPRFLKVTLSLGFHLDYQNDLGNSLCQFFLG